MTHPMTLEPQDLDALQPTREQQDGVRLEPCPWCGKKGATLKTDLRPANVEGWSEGWQVYCSDSVRCSGRRTRFEKTEAEAIAAWNRRAAPTAPPSDLDALEAVARAATTGEFGWRAHAYSSNWPPTVEFVLTFGPDVALSLITELRSRRGEGAGDRTVRNGDKAWDRGPPGGVWNNAPPPESAGAGCTNLAGDCGPCTQCDCWRSKGLEPEPAGKPGDGGAVEAGLNYPDTASRTHVPELEQWATNQRPKTSIWAELKLYRYDGSDLYQWWGRLCMVATWDACDEPFSITHLVPAQAVKPGEVEGLQPGDVEWLEKQLKPLRQVGIRREPDRVASAHIDRILAALNHGER